MAGIKKNVDFINETLRSPATLAGDAGGNKNSGRACDAEIFNITGGTLVNSLWLFLGFLSAPPNLFPPTY